MVKVLKCVCAAIAVPFLLVQFVRPDRSNPPVDEARAIQACTAMPAEVSSILERACRDCHSNETQWPWYSNVAPVSWLMTDDVATGRERMNFSEWADYDRTEAKALLAFMSWSAQNRTMPPESYARMHPEARLSDREVEALCEWVAAELEREPASR